MIIAYCAACGFAVAGLVASFIQWVTNAPPRFAVSFETIWTSLRDIFLVTFCGPFILMRNALRGRRIEKRPIGWLVASSAIALTWSACSGLVVVEVALAAAESVK